MPRDFYPVNDPKHYDIFFCGDSWTYGDELEESHREACRWSNIVSERTGRSSYNLSTPGNSNDWITTALLDWFESGNTSDVAVVQFTYNSRISYWTTKSALQIVAPQIVEREEHYWDPFIKFYSDYYRECYTDYSGCQMYAKNLCLIDSYLKSRGVKPIYLTIQPPVFNIPLDYFLGYSRKCAVKYLVDVIGTRKENYVKSSYHPNITGHSIIADYIISHL